MIERDTLQLDSWIVAAGRTHGPGEPLNVPVVPASNFHLGGELVYARDDGTPTILALEELLGGLEGGEAVAFASGMAAAAAVFDQLPAGASIALADDCYKGVAALAKVGESKGRWKVERLEAADTDAWIRAAGVADLLWLESPSNPLLEVSDLPAICAAPRKPGNLIAVDNTFATPINQRPLSTGADIVMHSATKFLGGHSDALMGAVVSRNRELIRSLRETRMLTGASPGALEAFLTTRGIRTLGLRLERSQANAGELAARLAQHPEVEVVRYPGLETHPTHAIAKRVLQGFGAVLSFDVAGGGEGADALCRALKLIRHATSLGGVESTLERRSIMPGQEHLPAGLLRFSVGCEHVEDLWRDLDQALASSPGAEAT